MGITNAKDYNDDELIRQHSMNISHWLASRIGLKWAIVTEIGHYIPYLFLMLYLGMLAARYPPPVLPKG